MIRDHRGQNPALIYMDADDVHVSTYLVYKDVDGGAFFDKDHQYPISDPKLLGDLFAKGLTIVDNGAFYTPFSMVETESGTIISYSDYDSTNKVFVYKTITNVVPISEEPEVLPTLLTFTLGDVTLTPEFASSTYEYTASTTSASDTLALTASSETAVISVELNDVPLVDYSTILWEAGENILAVSVSNVGSEQATVYTFTVTKGDAE